MRLLRATFLALCALAATCLAKDVYFNKHPVLWENADILIWTPDAQSPVDPRELCLSLKRNNSGIGEPKCRLYGEWERDTVAMHYAQWLQKNMDPALGEEYLHIRHPALMAKVQQLEDNIVLYLADNGNRINVAIFDETSTNPKVAGSVAKNVDKVALGDEIASTFFSGKTKRRLSKAERKKLMDEPDDLYQEVPKFRAWGGLAIGYSQAQIPLTPYTWYKSHVESEVRNYRITKDSVSLWNFIEDSDPLLNAYFGGIWYGFIGLELQYRFAKHKVKTDDDDPVYDELDHWNFYQHEIGLNALFSRTYNIKSWLDISLLLILGFQYSFFVEDIALNDDVKEPSRAYKVRIRFEEAYKGGVIAGGSQFVFKKHYGIGIRTGISTRGRDMYVDPTPDAAAAPTIIGGSTIDWFISLGLEYHFSPL